MKAPNPIAITAAVLFTSISLIALSPSTSMLPASEINGAKVITLPVVHVYPSSDDRRAAAMLSTASLTIAQSAFADKAESSASLLGAQLAMPYYSFGSAKLPRISKE